MTRLFSALVALTGLTGHLVAGYYAITGVQLGRGEDGSVPVRRNINEIAGSRDEQFDLLIQGLTAMREMPPDELTSWYSVSTIHGQPFAVWDGDQDPIANPSTGYCPHGYSTFVSWHRPYLMLYEQALVDRALEIAEGYPDNLRDTYRRAAETLRLPYWDWAEESVTQIPPAAGQPRIVIRVSSDSGAVEQEVDNPLFQYRFPTTVDGSGNEVSIPSAAKPVFNKCSRNPAGFPAGANNLLAGTNMKARVSQELFTENTLSSYRSWQNSVEGMHGTIHNMAGCGEDFATLSWSSFDALFVLHHNFVDLLAAYAQAINPDQGDFNDPVTLSGGLLTTPRGTVVTPDDPLKPFHKANDEAHTPRGVRSIQGLGYRYAAINYDTMDPSAVRASVIREVRERYGSTIAAASATPNTNTINSSNSSSTSSQRPPSDVNVQSFAPAAATPAANEKVVHFLNITLNREEIETPSTISIFIGDSLAGVTALMETIVSGPTTMRIPLREDVIQNQPKVPRRGLDFAVIADSIRFDIRNGEGDKIPVGSVASLSVIFEEIDLTEPASTEELPRTGEPRTRDVVVKDREE